VTEATLRRLEETVRAEGGLLAGALGDGKAAVEDGGPGLGALAASGPRAAAAAAEIALVVEAVFEGYLLHYGTPRLFADCDRDLLLLAGDRLYALGLARLAALGDLPAVAELADVISLCAQAQAEDDPVLAAAVWEAGAVAIGWGADDALRAAKAAARERRPEAPDALRAAARRLSGDVAPVGRGSRTSTQDPP
jgi:hypothetical protein